MNTTLLNNHTKFRAKIFKPYRIITFLVLGHFFSRTLYSLHTDPGKSWNLKSSGKSTKWLPHSLAMYTKICPEIKHTHPDSAAALSKCI